MTSLGPPPIQTEDPWTLETDPESLALTAERWSSRAEGIRAVATDLRERVIPVVSSGQWVGEGADSFHESMSILLGRLESCADLCAGLETTLREVDGVLTGVKGELDASLERAQAMASVVRLPQSTVVIFPLGDDSIAPIWTEIEASRRVRTGLEEALKNYRATFREYEERFYRVLHPQVGQPVPRPAARSAGEAL